MTEAAIAPWLWHSLPLQARTGSQVFACVQSEFSTDHPPLTLATLLESPYPTPGDYPQLSRYSLAAWGPRWVNGQPRQWTPGIGEIFPCLRSRLAEGRASHPLGLDLGLGSDPRASLPFTGGWLGWLGYDAAWEVERLPWLKPDALTFPIALWYEPETFLVLDHQDQVLWIAASTPETLSRLTQRLGSPEPDISDDREWLDSADLNLDLTLPPETLTFHTSQPAYERAVRQAKAHIQAGDIFQANLSLRFSVETRLSSWHLYRRLQTINPSPFASYWQTPWGDVVSCSPERLVQLRQQQNPLTRSAQTRPIAGTRPRGTTPEQDQQLAQDLLQNVKERAEHVMLVDLERNDLGRVCAWGTVQVDELFSIERYSHVMHLVSNITGEIRDSTVTSVDLIQAMFPGGTITGCPKVRCMEIIEALESERRSLFYGSCGYLDWRGSLDMNILIRTLLYQSSRQSSGYGSGSISNMTMSEKPPESLTWGKVWGQVGAGIVADSDPVREWQESLQKAKALWMALSPATKIVIGSLQ